MSHLHLQVRDGTVPPALIDRATAITFVSSRIEGSKYDLCFVWEFGALKISEEVKVEPHSSFFVQSLGILALICQTSAKVRFHSWYSLAVIYHLRA